MLINILILTLKCRQKTTTLLGHENEQFHSTVHWL